MVNHNLRINLLYLVENRVNATQNVENGVVWDSYESLKVTGYSTIRSRFKRLEILLAFHSNLTLPYVVAFLRYSEILDKIASFNLQHLYLEHQLEFQDLWYQ